MIKFKKLAIVSCVSFAFLASNAFASTYRDGEPPTLDQPKPAPVIDDSKQVIYAFNHAYSKAKSPRIALFWNIELTDQVEEEKRETLAVNSAKNYKNNRSEDISSDAVGSTSKGEVSAKETFSMSVSSGTTKVEQHHRQTTLSERDMWQLETEFTKRLLDAGVSMIDRSAIIRVTAASGTDHSNLKKLETSSLIGKADLLLEVLMTKDPEAPIGWGFRGSLKQIKSGKIMGSFYLKGMPNIAAQPAKYMATDKGFDRVEETLRISVPRIGHTLAIDTMRELTGRF